MIAAALVAAACSDRKDDDEAVSGGGTAATSAPAATDAPATTTGGTEGTTAGTDAPATTLATATTAAPATTEPAVEPVIGGTLVVSGEAEVANPWTPAAMQCDSYCQQRARTFYDPLVAYGADLEVHPFLAESVEPNADFTEWTVTLREGISFHDGTPLNADAVIYNLQATGTGVLVAGSLTDVAKVPSQADPNVMELKIEKNGPRSFTIFTGKGGDPTKPVPWVDFDAYLAGQLGLIASPTWLEAVKADPAKAAQPVGTGPFIFESYAPRDRLVVTKNPDYWMQDSEGRQLPYLDSIEFRVIEDGVTAGEALRSGEIDIFATSNANVIRDFQDSGDFAISLQDELTETNFINIDQSKQNDLADRRVRCALSMAINRQELIEATGGGILEPANGIFSPGQQGYLEDNGLSIEQDLEGAAALIEEYEAETGKQVAFQLGQTPTRTNDEVAELLHRLVERDRRRRSGARRAAGPVHHAGALRRPAVPGVPVAPARRRRRRPAVLLVALRRVAPRRRALAQLRADQQPGDRRGVGHGPLGQRSGRGHGGRRGGQPAVRRELHLHPAVVDPVGHHQRAVGAGPRHVHHARRCAGP